MAYRLALFPYSHVHIVFHVSCLKKVIDYKIPIHIILPEVNKEEKFILGHKLVIETRIKQLKNRAIIEYLKWKNMSTKDATWEDELFIHKSPIYQH
jgi:hypothetical protein